MEWTNSYQLPSGVHVSTCMHVHVYTYTHINVINHCQKTVLVHSHGWGRGPWGLTTNLAIQPTTEDPERGQSLSSVVYILVSPPSSNSPNWEFQTHAHTALVKLNEFCHKTKRKDMNVEMGFRGLEVGRGGQSIQNVFYTCIKCHRTNYTTKRTNKFSFMIIKVTHIIS